MCIIAGKPRERPHYHEIWGLRGRCFCWLLRLYWQRRELSQVCYGGSIGNMT